MMQSSKGIVFSLVAPVLVKQVRGDSEKLDAFSETGTVAYPFRFLRQHLHSKLILSAGGRYR